MAMYAFMQKQFDLAEKFCQITELFVLATKQVSFHQKLCEIKAMYAFL